MFFKVHLLTTAYLEKVGYIRACIPYMPSNPGDFELEMGLGDWDKRPKSRSLKFYINTVLYNHYRSHLFLYHLYLYHVRLELQGLTDA